MDNLYSAIDELNKIDPTWVYRYRSMNALSIKELMYDEVYFSYAEELNDPFDLYSDIVIKEGASHVYDFILSGVFNHPILKLHYSDVSSVKRFIMETSLLFCKTTRKVEFLASEYIEDFLLEQMRKHKLSTDYSVEVLRFFKNTITNLLPRNNLSVSFSKDYKDPMLWSLYSDSHTGFCKVFIPDNKKIKLKSYRNSEYKDYEFGEVKYSEDVYVDLSLMFDKNKNFCWDQLHKNYFPELRKKTLFTKHTSWQHEAEVRLDLLDTGIVFSHREEHKPKLALTEKIYHYDPVQLRGIIFGCKMNDDDRNQIYKIYELKKQQIRFYEAFQMGNRIEVSFLKGVF